MKYVRNKDGKIEIMEDGANIPAGAETIFSTDPAVYEGTWDKPAEYVEHADVVMTKMGSGIKREGTEAKYEVDERLGTQKPPQEKILKAIERGKGDRPFWTEPHKAHPKDKVCLHCGKKMVGVRPNRKFCSENCRKRYSEKIKRAEKRAVRDFKPHMGKEGQIYFMLDGKISFIPALWCDSQKRVESYVKTNYPEEIGKEILEQVKEVMGNGKR